MRRPAFSFSLALSLLLMGGGATAAPLIPKMNEPESYHDFRFGLDEMRQNIESVQCGGWHDGWATVRIEDGEPGCTVDFECKDSVNSCGGTTGRTGLRNPDGSIPLCLSNLAPGSGIIESLLVHELVHAKQACAAELGEPLGTTRASCCQNERQAYTAQCQLQAANGQFDVPYNGITIDVESCVMYGMNMVSCSSFGPDACGPYNFPPGFGDAYLQAGLAAPGYSCADITSNPPPSAKTLLDEIETMSNTGKGKVDGEMPYPFVSPDIPGRENKMPAMSKAITGLDERTEFNYPDSAFGYLSACNIYDPQGYDRDLERLGLDIIYDDVDVDQDPNPRVVPGSGKIDINPYRWCIRMDKATPRWCEKLFETWRRMADIAPRPYSDDFCICPPDALQCPSGPPKRYCFDYAAAAPHQERTEPTGQVGVIESADLTKECNGQECRTPWMPEFGNELIKCEWGIPQFDPDGNYIGQIPSKVEGGYDFGKATSFYRHYGNPFSDWSETKLASQTPLTVTAPTKTWKVRGDCYEYYQAHLDYPRGNQWTELDPKDVVTSPYDEQCELTILTQDEQSPDPPQWDDGGPNGEKQKDIVKAPFFDVEEPPREPRPTPDPWVPDSESNLTLIDMKELKEIQKNFLDPTDITGVLSTILTTRQRGSKTLPKNARTDQFDDSDHRALAIFWEKQQRELLKMTADPQTRLIMPARFLVGIADDDPLFQYVKHTVSRGDGTVELTLKAGPEDLENVLKSFTRIFIAPIQEVRIPVLLPQASIAEIDSLIFQWKQWKQGENKAAEQQARSSKAGGADAIIDKLEEYRDEIAKVRRTREALAQELTRMYDTQEEIRTYFAEWFKEQTDQFLLAIQRAEQRRDLKRIWRLLQRSMLQTDECQMYYCSNQRYSTPVYSLLDNWWGDPSVLPGDSRDHGYTPPYDLSTLGFSQPPDQVFDFSNMKFSPDPQLIPVLWPVTVKIALPSPPMFGVDAPSPDTFPSLPTLPDETAFDSFPIPEVDLSEKPTITLPPTPDLTQAMTMLREVRKIVDGTPIDIQVLEEADLKNGESIDDGGFPPAGLQPNRYSMRSAYCRLQPSVLTPPDDEQRRGKEEKIIHTENDLKERISRLFARWLPERSEDFAGRVARRLVQFPEPENQPKCHEDVVCYFLPPEITKQTSWQWFMPSAAKTELQNLEAQLKNMTLPANEDDVFYQEASLDLLKRVFSDIPLPPQLFIHASQSHP